MDVGKKQDVVQSDRSTGNLLKKHNDLIVMSPVVKELTPLSRKLYNVLLKETQRQWAEVLQRTGVPPLVNHVFFGTLKNLLSMAAAKDDDVDGMYKRGAACIKEMEDTRVSWNPVEKNIEEAWGSMHLLSQAKIYKKEKVIHVKWSLPPDIIDRLIDQHSRFTLLNLSQLIKLKTYSSLALYEIVSSYRNHMSTSAHPPEWWASALLPSAVSKREWRKVKNEQLMNAVKDINDLTDLVVEGPIEKREGGLRSPVVSVHFNVRVKPKEVLTKDAPNSTAFSAETTMLAAQAGVSGRSLELILREFPAKGGTISQGALTKMQGRSIDSPDPYFIKAAREIGARDHATTVQDQRKPRLVPADIEEDPAAVADRARMLSLPHDELVALGQRALDAMPPATLGQKLLNSWNLFKSGETPMPTLVRAHALKIFRQEMPTTGDAK